MGTFGSRAAAARNVASSSGTTVQETGSVRPPWGGMRSGIARPPLGETEEILNRASGMRCADREADEGPVVSGDEVEGHPCDGDQDEARAKHIAETQVARGVGDGVAGRADRQ